MGNKLTLFKNDSGQNIYQKYPAIGAFVAFVIIVLTFAILDKSHVFLGKTNIFNIFKQTASISIVSFGMTAILLVGCIDLSVGSTVALCSVSTAMMLKGQVNIFVIIIAVIAIGILVGLLNGFITTFFNIQPFLVTLATMGIIRGAAMMVTGSKSVFIDNEKFRAVFSEGNVFGIPVLLLWTIFFFVITYFLISKTVLGRRIQAIGGNEDAAINSGINTKKVKIIVYCISGVLAGFAGLMTLSRLGSGLPTSGNGVEMDAIAACVLGGTGFKGEGGNMFGTLLGSLAMGTVMSGMTVLHVDSAPQTIIKGIIILVIVIITTVLSSKKSN